MWQTTAQYNKIKNDIASLTLAQINKYATQRLEIPISLPTIMKVDDSIRFLCPYNFSTNILSSPFTLGDKVLAKLNFLDFYAYKDFIVLPPFIKTIEDAYTNGIKQNILQSDKTPTNQMHNQLNAILMHLPPGNMPFLYRTDMKKILDEVGNLPFVEKTSQGTLKFIIKLPSWLRKQLRQEEARAGNIFQNQVRGDRNRLDENRKPISLRKTTVQLLEQLIRLAMVGSYQQPSSNTFQGGATHRAFQQPMIDAQFRPIPTDQYIDSITNGLLSKKMYQLYAEMAEQMPSAETSSFLYTIPQYRIGAIGSIQNDQKKQRFIQSFEALPSESQDSIDALLQVVGLPLLVKREPESSKDKEPVHETDKQMREWVDKLMAKQKQLQKTGTQEERQLATKRIKALEEGDAKGFRVKYGTSPTWGWQGVLKEWKSSKSGLPYFSRYCTPINIDPSKMYCQWEPLTEKAKKEYKEKLQKANSKKASSSTLNSQATTKDTSMSNSRNVTLNHKQTGIGIQYDALGKDRLNKSKDAKALASEERKRYEREAAQLALAKHHQNLRTAPDKVIHGNRGQGSVRIFTAKDAAGNDIFTVLPHNLIANIMILAFSAIIIYSGAQGGNAYRALYLVQTDDRSTKLQSLYPARGAATFFFGLGFGTIIAFLASIVEFFNYWRFRYVFGLVLIALPVIILGSMGISNLTDQNNALSKVLNAPDATDASGNDLADQDPGLFSSIFGTEYQEYVEEVEEARESLTISDLLFMGVGFGALGSGIMFAIPGSPFHTDRNELAIKEMRDGKLGERAQSSHIKTHWIVYPAILTVVAIAAAISSIAVATGGGPEIKRTDSETDDDDENTTYDITKNVAWPAVQSCIIMIVVSLLLFGAIVLVGYLRQQHAKNLAAGNLLINNQLRNANKAKANAQARSGTSTGLNYPTFTKRS